MTRLEAVNIILSVCGLGRVAALHTNYRSEAGYAENILDETELRVQKIGWYYNTLRDVELAIDGDSKLPVPTGTIWIDSDSGDSYRNITQRGGFLYDLDNNVDTFAGSLRVKYVQRLDFDCIPHVIADAIANNAASLFVQRYGRRFIPNSELAFVSRSANQLMRQTWVEAKRWEADTANINVLELPGVLAVKGDEGSQAVRVSDIRGTL